MPRNSSMSMEWIWHSWTRRKIFTMLRTKIFTMLRDLFCGICRCIYWLQLLEFIFIITTSFIDWLFALDLCKISQKIKLKMCSAQIPLRNTREIINKLKIAFCVCVLIVCFRFYVLSHCRRTEHPWIELISNLSRTIPVIKSTLIKISD